MCINSPWEFDRDRLQPSVQSAMPNHSLLLGYCTCHSGRVFQPLQQNFKLHIFRISQFACNQIILVFGRQTHFKVFFASSSSFFQGDWSCKVCTGHSLMSQLHPSSYEEHRMVPCLGWNAPCDLCPEPQHLFQCGMRTIRGGTKFNQRADAKSPKSSTVCYLHQWKNLQRAYPVAPRKPLQVKWGALCSYGPHGIITQRAKTDPALRNRGQIIWSALIVSLRGVWSGYMLLQWRGFPQMGHEESPVPPSAIFDRSRLWSC